jgi:divalent metal cation (Fe/Co/Zn/Cd) transporter
MHTRMRRVARLVVGLALLVGGVVIGVYGLFALLYNGDCQRDCGDVYVTIDGHRMNANHVGWIVLAIAASAIVLGGWLLRRHGARPEALS